MSIHLDVKQFVKGTCFICLQIIKEDPEAYCHIHCAYAISDEKERRVKEALKTQEAKYT